MGKKILIADDTDIVREMVKDVLIDLGYEVNDVLIARDGQEAIDLIMAFRDSIGLVITDFNMPRANGDEVIKVARGYGISCILMTDDKIAVDKMEKSNVVFLHLEKPFDYNGMQSVISGLTQRCK